jgi:hypothetical protein
MNRTVPMQLRTPFRRRTDMMTLNLKLQAEVAALIEDNKQLRAALSIYSEVARRAPATLLAGPQVA